MSLPMPEHSVVTSLPEPTRLKGPRFPDRNPDNGKVLRTSDNLSALLDFCGYKGRYNLMTAEPELTDDSFSRLGGSAAGQRSMLVDACQRYGLSEQTIDDHLIALCERNSYHPVRVWLESGPDWDGDDRLTGVLQTLGAQNSDYAKQVMTPWLVGCIASLYENTFHSKLVPVLQGGQSSMKSAWLHRICSVTTGAYGNGSLNPDKTDDVRRVCSHWINELAELESTTRHEAGSLKAFITRSTDKFRIPYARDFTIKQRQTSFIATVNGSGFLKDQTGNTRFAVIELAKPVLIDYLNMYLGWVWNGRATLEYPESLRQFWLQIKKLYDNGASWFLDTETQNIAAAVNDPHTDKGAYYTAIVDRHLNTEFGKPKWLTATDVCKLHGERTGLSGQYGKALKLLTEEGKIESRSVRGGRTEYQIWITDNDAIRLITRN
ncbi:TPA: hypothetical protein ON228_003950 [Escherichia coli]|nr:hypothetical protein [Escherichia coli]